MLIPRNRKLLWPICYNVNISGAFTLVLNQELDIINYKRVNNPKTQIDVHNIMGTLDLIDNYRENNSTLRKCT